MHRVLIQFRENIRYARELGGIFSAIKGITTPAINAEDILRAQIVFAVSALDYFIHEIVRIGMLEIQEGNRLSTDAFNKFQIPMSTAIIALHGISHTQWLDKIVREKHSWISFQDPQKIADAIRIICLKELWKEVGKEIELSEVDVKKKLRIIIDRRNKIAHEADMDPVNPGFRWSVDEQQAGDTIHFIEKVVGAIYKIVTSSQRKLGKRQSKKLEIMRGDWQAQKDSNPH